LPAPPTPGLLPAGAHFDTVAETPGADDNASGVAVLLEVARLTREAPTPVPWALWASPPRNPRFFHSLHGQPGVCQGGPEKTENLLGMLCLESVGYFVQEPHSQQIPLALKFLGYSTPATTWAWWPTGIPASPAQTGKGLASGFLPAGVQPGGAPGGSLIPETRLSDHANFWDEGYQAVMVTDTAFLRNPNYHTPGTL